MSTTKITLILVLYFFIKVIHAQNVGIGISSPAEKLHVNGSLRVDGAITSQFYVSSAQNFSSIGNGVTSRTFTELFNIGGNTRIDGQIAIGGINSGGTAILVSSSWPNESLIMKGGNYLGVGSNTTAPTNTIYLHSIGGRFAFYQSGLLRSLFRGAFDYEITHHAPDASAGTPTRDVTIDLISKYWDGASSISNSPISLNAIATNTSGASKLGVELGGVEIWKYNSDGSVTLSPITAVTASSITPEEGKMLFVSTTDATFTQIGLWIYENSVWRKL